MNKDFNKLKRLDRRLARIESVRGADDLLLHFKDGSSRVIKIPRNQRQSWLTLFLTGMEMFHYFRCARHGDRYDRDPPGEKPAELCVPEHLQRLVRLIGSAVSAESEDRSFGTSIHRICVSVVQEEAKPLRPGRLIHTGYTRAITPLPPEEQARVAPVVAQKPDSTEPA